MGAVEVAAATVMSAPQSHGRSVDAQARKGFRVGGRCNQKLEGDLLAQQSLRIDILTQKNSDISLHFWFLSKPFRGLNQLRRRGSMTRFRDISDLSPIQHPSIRQASRAIEASLDLFNSSPLPIPPLRARLRFDGGVPLVIDP